jgi:hypothetical protein
MNRKFVMCDGDYSAVCTVQKTSKLQMNIYSCAILYQSINYPILPRELINTKFV